MARRSNEPSPRRTWANGPIRAPARRRGAARRPDAALPTSTKLAYGLGEAAEGIKSATLETFLFFYYVQVLGLSGALAGLALLVALVFDGVVDPLIGQASDRLHSALGRRHPFLYAAPVPLAIFLVLLFCPPHGLQGAPLFAWMLGFTVLTRFFQSIYFVPHMALGAELSTDYRARISVSSYRTLFSLLGRLAAVGVAFSLFFRATPAFANGQLNPAAYAPFASVCGVAAAAVILASAAGTHPRATRLQQHQAGGERPRHPAWGAGVINALRLPSFAIYFTSVLINYILGGVQAALAIHLNTYFWRLAPGEIQTVFFANTFGFIAGIALARPLAARWDKKAAYVACLALSVIVICLPTVLALAGFAPLLSGAHRAWLLAGFTFAAGLIGGPAVVLAGAMLADVADAYRLRFHANGEGLLFGLSALTRKASMGVGGALAGAALDLIHFPHGPGAGSVSATDAARVAILYGPGVLLFSLVAAGLMGFYDLSRDKHGEILRALAERDDE